MPVNFLEEISKDTSIGLWRIEENPEELEEQLQLKTHELDLLNSLNGNKRNMQWLATRVLLRKMLNTNEYIDCRADENGKPILLNLPHHISLSHSYDYAAVMISKNARVGIDIELIKTKIERVQHKFLNNLELSFINKKNRIDHLYTCWCAKEALYKLNGKKETSFKDNIHLKPFDYNQKGKIECSISRDNESKDYTVSYRKFDDYMLGYVYETE